MISERYGASAPAEAKEAAERRRLGQDAKSLRPSGAPRRATSAGLNSAPSCALPASTSPLDTPACDVLRARVRAHVLIYATAAQATVRSGRGGHTARRRGASVAPVEPEELVATPKGCLSERERGTYIVVLYTTYPQHVVFPSSRSTPPRLSAPPAPPAPLSGRSAPAVPLLRTRPLDTSPPRGYIGC